MEVSYKCTKELQVGFDFDNLNSLRAVLAYRGLRQVVMGKWDSLVIQRCLLNLTIVLCLWYRDAETYYPHSIFTLHVVICAHSFPEDAPVSWNPHCIIYIATDVYEGLSLTTTTVVVVKAVPRYEVLVIVAYKKQEIWVCVAGMVVPLI